MDNNNIIYMDHAATTPVDTDVLAAMMPFFTEYYGNPSAIHSVGSFAKTAVENARETVANVINAQTQEIIFTSGGTESDNAALLGAALSRPKRKHILTTPIEHHAVLNPLHYLEEFGWEVEMLPVSHDGLVNSEDVKNRLRDNTLLVSVMHGNNEVGTLQPIGEIGAACRDAGILFHTDAVQTFGKVPIDVRAMKIDLLSISAHKLYGPKGIGALYVRRGVPLTPHMLGGGQESGRRSGTLNVPGIVGLGKAAELAQQLMPGESKRLNELANCLVEEIESRLQGVHLSGSQMSRVPGNVHLCIEGLEGEPILLALDAAGICASAGSACSAGSTEPSHVLKSMGVSRDLARGAIRITMGRKTTIEDVMKTANVLIQAVTDLRKL